MKGNKIWDLKLPAQSIGYIAAGKTEMSMNDIHTRNQTAVLFYISIDQIFQNTVIHPQ